MKTAKSSLLILLLAAGFCAPVHAGRYDEGYGRRDHQSHNPSRHHHHHHRHWSGVAAAVLVGGVIGAGLYQNAYPQPVVVIPPPRPVIVQPPVYAAPAPEVWYYCASAGQYYPYVRHCREGWLPVAPQPQ